MTFNLRNRFKLSERAIPPVYPKTQGVGVSTYFQTFRNLAFYDCSQATQEIVKLAQDQGISYPCYHNGTIACQCRSFDPDRIFLRGHKPAPANTHGSVAYGFILRGRRIKRTPRLDEVERIRIFVQGVSSHTLRSAPQGRIRRFLSKSNLVQYRCHTIRIQALRNARRPTFQDFPGMKCHLPWDSFKNWQGCIDRDVAATPCNNHLCACY